MRSELAASHGEPSYLWRAGQQRRLEMIRRSAGSRDRRRVLEVGCGLGLYLKRLADDASFAVGVEYERDRAKQAAATSQPAAVIVAANEALPFPEGSFDLVLTNEVIEHVANDSVSAGELVRVLRPGGRIVLFCPNRWYPVEQHGVYWRGVYHFGNVPLINYFPDPVRNHLAPHVRTYSLRRLRSLFSGLPVREVCHRRVFGGYDNIVAKFGLLGRALRAVLQASEVTPFSFFGLSHMLVLERTVEPDHT